MSSCCCPTLSCSGLWRVQSERCSRSCRRQLGPLLRRFCLCGRRPQQVQQGNLGRPLESRHTVISAERAPTSATSLCVCLCVYACVSVSGCVCVCVCASVEGTEERNMPFWAQTSCQLLAALHTFDVQTPGHSRQMRRGVLGTKLNSQYGSHEPKSLFHLASSLPDVSTAAPLA